MFWDCISGQVDLCPEIFVFTALHSSKPNHRLCQARTFSQGDQGTLDSTGRAFHAGHLGSAWFYGRSLFSEVFLMCLCSWCWPNQAGLRALPLHLGWE